MDSSIQNNENVNLDSSDENENSHEDSYLEPKNDHESHKLYVIAGDKENTEWLVIDDVYILHKYSGTDKVTFWECSGRRAFNCPFKAATFIDDENELQLNMMYKLDTHDCGQTKLGPIMQKFRTTLKSRMCENFKTKFHQIFAVEKKKLLDQYKDNPDLLERIIYELKDKRCYRVCAQRARAKVFPKNPTCAAEMDLDLIGLKKIELGRSSHFDPEIKDKEIIILGTPLTAKAWAQSEFKSKDGTFKICP